MESGKIVFIEDSIHDAELIRLSFQETNFNGELLHFEAGTVFLEYLHAEKPQDIRLLILDMDMPIMTGLETLEHLNQRNLKNFPVVFLSSSVNGRNIAKAKALKADAYMGKSIHLDDFQKTIKDIWNSYGKPNQLPYARIGC